MNVEAGRISAVRPRGSHQMVGRAAENTLNRLAQLVVETYALRERVIHASSGNHFDQSLSPVLQELEAVQRELTLEAAADSSTDRDRALAPATAEPNHSGAFASPIEFAARLMAECKACGRKACALLRKAQAAGRRECARLAYALIRNLEKLFWVLQVHAGSAAFA